jgi:hypothetical protein
VQAHELLGSGKTRVGWLQRNNVRNQRKLERLNAALGGNEWAERVDACQGKAGRLINNYNNTRIVIWCVLILALAVIAVVSLPVAGS